MRPILEEPETDRRSELERTTKMLFKRGSLPWGRKGEVGNVRGGLVASMPGGGGGALLGC